MAKETLPLPIGMTEFEELVTKVADHSQSPTKDRDSLTFAIASIIMHLGEAEDELTLDYIIKRLRAGAAKQIAGAAFHDVKLKHKAAQEAAAAKATETT